MNINDFKTTTDPSKPKCYVLDMFPYPSGEGLHMGHVKVYTASDIYARYKRMKGYNVLHPTGFDAFGLPAEQFALKNKIHPRISTDKNIATYLKQMQALDFSYDYDRVVDTTDYNFYKWTQWIFKQIYNKGLAYESNEPINWCPSCKTGLANEDLEGNACERCGTVVEKKPLRQWVLKITDYADRLIDDLDTLTGWPQSFIDLEKNWIGRSEGSSFVFKVNHEAVTSVEIFTTRADTLFGATYVAISYELAEKWIQAGWIADDSIVKFIENVKEENAARVFDRKDVIEKKGIQTGLTAHNPANGEALPIWIADYILPGYGTGAIMAVPAHDDRDFEFATKYNIPIKRVIFQNDGIFRDTVQNKPNVEEGTLTNSREYDGLTSEEAKIKITEAFGGTFVKQYKLKDWVFSRQRYWGEPFPIVFDEHHTSYVVADSELPVKLPDVEEYEPTGTGESPLANIKDWVEVYGYLNEDNEFVSCEKSDTHAKLFTRETNTMPQWAGSSWYYLRFIDAHNQKEILAKDLEKYWQPVDVYVGGAEHATRHLIYARFWHKFLYDIGVVSSVEPFTRLESVGLILGEGGVKMSKRLGNVINPDDVIKEYGSDIARMYVMFMGPFGQSSAWDSKSIQGVKKFLDRVKRLKEKVGGEIDDTIILNQSIKKIGDDIEEFKFNTSISQLMILLNFYEEKGSVSKDSFKIFLRLLAPFAPATSEELWQNLGNHISVHTSVWPTYEEKYLVTNEVTLAIQIAGKMRGTIEIARDSEDSVVIEAVKNHEMYQKYVGNLEPKKIIIVKNKIVNIVI
jgi:leucyl-tRNA synthetase